MAGSTALIAIVAIIAIIAVVVMADFKVKSLTEENTVGQAVRIYAQEPICGDSICQSTESCATCSKDCGSCS